VCVELELEKVIGMGQFGVVLEVAAISNHRGGGVPGPGPFQVGGGCTICSRLWCSHRNLKAPSDDVAPIVFAPPNVKELLERSQEILHCSHARRQSISEQQQQQQQQQETVRTTASTVLLRSGTSSFDTNSSEEEDYIDDVRNYMSLHYLRKSDGIPRYAVKQIRKDLYPKKKLEAAVQLAQEAKLIACLKHPHIIQLKATVGVPGHADFMIVMERLPNGTLYDKLMVQWKSAQGEGASSLASGGRFLANLLLQHNSRRRVVDVAHTLLMDRLSALCDIAQAMAYLHSKM
jgi:serine/threonine protein kinase